MGARGWEFISIIVLIVAIIGGISTVWIALHYVLFLLATHPKDATEIGRELNEFERRQLVEWAPKADDFLKHDDEHRTYDDVFGPYRSALENYSTCVFPRTPFTQRYASDYLLLKPKDGMRLLELGCGSGAAANYFASQSNVDITCVTNSPVQGDICRRKFEKYGGRLRVMVTDFDALSLPDASFDMIYAFEFDRLFQGCRCLASALLEHAQAGRARADPVARITGLLSPRKGFPERHRVLRELALQFSRCQHPGVQVTAARICPDTLSASAVLGLGPNLEFFPAFVLVEISAQDAHHGRPRKNHLAHLQSLRVRQRLQHRAGD